MSQNSSRPGHKGPRVEKKPRLPPEVMELILPTLQIGAVTGTVGLFAGAVEGIMRSKSPVLYSLVAGPHWFVLGTSYYASRRLIIKTWGGEERFTWSGKVIASGAAGGCAGFAGGLIRGSRTVVPAMIVLSAFGAGGQAIANIIPARDASRPKTSWLDSRWSPLTPLTDQQYEKFLEEKILKLEAEIAVVDDNIAALRISSPRTGGDGHASA